ncbi:unnamed protein product [Rotaria socialis]
MGACFGKKSAKYSTQYKTQLQQPKKQEEIEPKEPSPSLSKKLQNTDGVTEENNGEFRTSELIGNSIDSEVELIIDEQKKINEVLCQPFPSRIVSVTESELEYELANLIYGHPEIDYLSNNGDIFSYRQCSNANVKHLQYREPYAVNNLLSRFEERTMLDLGQTNEPVYYGSDQVQRTNETQLRDVEKRDGELHQLETDIVHLHEIHRDFAELVNDHGSVIDNIESSVSQTETHVTAGAKKLGQTVELQSAVRRKKILCGLIVFIIIAIAIIIAVVFATKKKS